VSEQQKLAVTVVEAAAMLSLSPRTVQNYVYAKRIPARKIGRRTLIPVRALETFLRTDQPSASRIVQEGERAGTV